MTKIGGAGAITFGTNTLIEGATQVRRRQGGINLLGEAADAYEKAVSGGLAEEWYLRSRTWLNIGGLAFEFSSAGGYSKFLRTTPLRDLPKASSEALTEAATRLKTKFSNIFPGTFNFREFGLPQIYGGQVGLRNPAFVDDIKEAMKAGEFRYDSKEGIIGAWRNARGQIHVSDGHHRVIAALELAQETGDTQYILNLLRNARIREIDEFYQSILYPLPFR